jgi:hypothetical protein
MTSEISAARRRRLNLGLAAMLACLTLLGGACGGGDDGGGDADSGSVAVSSDPVILPADTRQIIEDLQAKIDEANATLDVALQDSIEASPARDIDDAFFKGFKAKGQTSAGSTRRRLADAQVYVPRQTDYPARFFAFVKLANADDPAAPQISRLRVYEKSAADEPWKLALYVTVPRDFVLPEISVDSDGFAETVGEDEGDGLKVEPSRLPDEFADYLSGFAEGTDSEIFAPGRFTSEASQALKASVEKDAQATITTTVEVSPGGYPVQAFRTADGGAVALFTENVNYSYAPLPGKVLNPISGSEGLLDPGEYTSLQRNVVNMVAAVIPPADAEGLVQIVGTTGGTVSFDGEPAAPPSPSPSGSPAPPPPTASP